MAELDFVQDYNSDPWHNYVHVYISYEWEGQPTESDEMNPEWFEFSSIPYKEMWDDDKYWLGRVVSGEQLSGEFTFDENNKNAQPQNHPGKL